ncbi:hypothetical protein A8C75_18640 [Marinobacterium aestuarii]|uniref:Uncharacterized protein n=1 Tax=Marinobacterium aestuarii TaxID=1821621 RepID=A0A1A9F354_9GAMM|nr:hypothetical protein [Marinobacterium aestuarii]ANG64291.1 hypothetical protein A8C75_18640 [Marinobacterium aestuarii]
MKGESFDADKLSNQLIIDGRVEVKLSMLKGRFLDQMIKTDLRLAYTMNDGQILRNILLAKGIVLTLFSSFFLHDVTEVFDFYVMNRSKINIRKERVENSCAQFVFVLK